jgi:predicted membrane-bound mannosyltransferase
LLVIAPLKLDGKRQSWLPLLLIILLALALRVYHLGFQSLWIDESFTRLYSESPLSYLWTTGFRSETNPPLYYTALHVWMLFFGASEWKTKRKRGQKTKTGTGTNGINLSEP